MQGTTPLYWVGIVVFCDLHNNSVKSPFTLEMSQFDATNRSHGNSYGQWRATIGFSLNVSTEFDEFSD